MNETRLYPIAALLVVLSMMLAGCGTTGAPSSAPPTAPAKTVAPAPATPSPVKVTKLRIGITSATAPPTILPLLGQSFGYASGASLDFQLVNLKPDVAAQALATGELEVLAAPSIQSAILQGLEARVVAGAAKPYFSLWGRKGVVESWKDLRGKRLGVPAGKGSAADVLFTNLLEREGISASQVTFFYNAAATNYQALAAGSVDAALTTPPYTYQLAKAGSFVQVDDLAAKIGTSLSTEYTMPKKLVDGDPDLVKRFVGVLLQVEKVLYTKPLDPKVIETHEKYLKESGVDPKELEIGKFFDELAQRKAWQVIPKRVLIQEGLRLLGQIPSSKEAAGKAKFDDIVYVVPSLANEY